MGTNGNTQKSPAYSNVDDTVFSSTSAWLAALQRFMSNDVIAVVEDSVFPSGYDVFAASACVVDVGGVSEVVGWCIFWGIWW